MKQMKQSTKKNIAGTEAHEAHLGVGLKCEAQADDERVADILQNLSLSFRVRNLLGQATRVRAQVGAGRDGVQTCLRLTS